jgi:RNA polymerase sigma-70 factor (ECF subfamily)
MPNPDQPVAPSPAPEADLHGLAPLLEGALAGDRAALDALLGQLRPYLHALVMKRLGPEAGGLVDQSALVQEGLLRIYQNLGRLRGKTVPQLLGWVGQIIRHLIIDAAPRPGAPKAQDARLLEGLIGDSSGGAKDLADRRSARVREALMQLSERRRQVIQLTFLDQLPDVEIGRQMGGGVGAIRVLRFRALQDLRHLLDASADSDCRPPIHA